MEIYGVKLIGVNVHAGEKLLFTLGFILVFVILRKIFKALTQLLFSRYQEVRLRFGSVRASTSGRHCSYSWACFRSGSTIRPISRRVSGWHRPGLRLRCSGSLRRLRRLREHCAFGEPVRDVARSRHARSNVASPGDAQCVACRQIRLFPGLRWS